LMNRRAKMAPTRPPSSGIGRICASASRKRAGRAALDVRLDRMEADRGEGVLGPGGEGQPLTASTPPHLRSRPKDRRAPPAPAVDGSRREGAGAEPTDGPRGHFLLILINAGLGLLSIGGSRTVVGGGGGPLTLAELSPGDQPFLRDCGPGSKPISWGSSRFPPLGPRLAHGYPLPAGMAPTPTVELKLTIALNICDGGLDLSDLPAELLVLLLQAAALEGRYDLLPLAACLISSS